jgi:hypothetical protein
MAVTWTYEIHNGQHHCDLGSTTCMYCTKRIETRNRYHVTGETFVWRTERYIIQEEPL